MKGRRSTTSTKTARSRSPRLLLHFPTSAELVEAAHLLSPQLRWLVGVPAVLVWCQGARLGRSGIPAAVFIAGALMGHTALGLASLDTWVWEVAVPEIPPGAWWPTWHVWELEMGVPRRAPGPLGAAMLGGVVAMWAELLHHRLGLAVVGAWLGASGVAFLVGGTAWVGAAVGAALAPWIYETIPRLTSAAVGAIALGWILGGAEVMAWIAGCWGAGFVLQLFTDGPAWQTRIGTSATAPEGG